MCFEDGRSSQKLRNIDELLKGEEYQKQAFSCSLLKACRDVSTLALVPWGSVWIADLKNCLGVDLSCFNPLNTLLQEQQENNAMYLGSKPKVLYNFFWNGFQAATYQNMDFFYKKYQVKFSGKTNIVWSYALVSLYDMYISVSCVVPCLPKCLM